MNRNAVALLQQIVKARIARTLGGKYSFQNQHVIVATWREIFT
jgi:hypothetical protein